VLLCNILTQALCFSVFDVLRRIMLTNVFVLESHSLVEFILSAPDTKYGNADLSIYHGVWFVLKVLYDLISRSLFYQYVYMFLCTCLTSIYLSVCLSVCPIF